MTRADAEIVLLASVRSAYRMAKLDGITSNGTNADLSIPIAKALAWVGARPPTIMNPNDGDVAAVPPDDWAAFLDYALLMALETALDNYTRVDENVGPSGRKLDQYAKRLESRIEGLRKKLGLETAEGGDGPGDLSGGSIDYGISWC